MRDVRILRKLHCLETMAVEIYRAQAARLEDRGEREMMAAAQENEAVHREAFRSILAERGAAPSPLRLFWWMAGRVLGTATALLGRHSLLAGDAAFERKAVREYGEIIDRGIFAGDEACLIARFLEDEKRHVANWQGLLAGAARRQA
jgi:demethoxyubiquinone hydroxylase (CLK1/Coq7/Cat5 family)